MAPNESASNDTEENEESEYNVVVDFSAGLTLDTVTSEFADATHVEGIGLQMYQVGYGATAATPAEAYRKVARVIESKLALINTDPEIVTAHVYGDGTKRVFGRHTTEEDPTEITV